MRLLPVFLMIGCVSFNELEDRAGITSEICEWEVNYSFDGSMLLDVNVSEECRKSILDDFRADDLTLDAEQTLINGSWGLLSNHWEIDHPSLNDHILETESVLGEDELGRTLYNWSSSKFSKTMSKEMEYMLASYKQGRDALVLDQSQFPLIGVHILIHEAKHAEDLKRHIRCPWDRSLRECDSDELGAYGTNIAILESIHSEDEYLMEVLELQFEFFGERILNK